MKRNAKITTALACLVVLLVVAAYLFWLRWGKPLNDWSRKTTTIVRMRDLRDVLLAFQPKDLSEDSLTLLLKESGRPECLTDGWGQKLLVSSDLCGGSEPTYRVQSLGADGKPGNCCSGLVDDSAEDAVLCGDSFQQQWSQKRIE